MIALQSLVKERWDIISNSCNRIGTRTPHRREHKAKIFYWEQKSMYIQWPLFFLKEEIEIVILSARLNLKIYTQNWTTTADYYSIITNLHHLTENQQSTALSKLYLSIQIGFALVRMWSKLQIGKIRFCQDITYSVKIL